MEPGDIATEAGDIAMEAGDIVLEQEGKKLTTNVTNCTNELRS